MIKGDSQTYAKEINEALDRRDLDTVWDLMFKRSAWISQSRLTESEKAVILTETIEIRSQLEKIQTQIKEQITGTIESLHAVQAYGPWRNYNETKPKHDSQK